MRIFPHVLFYQSQPFSAASADLHLVQPDGPTYFLAASYTSDDGSKKPCKPFALDQVLGNKKGEFVWGMRSFSKFAKSVQLNGSVLSATLLVAGGGNLRHIDLDGRFGLNPITKSLIALNLPVS